MYIALHMCAQRTVIVDFEWITNLLFTAAIEIADQNILGFGGNHGTVAIIEQHITRFDSNCCGSCAIYDNYSKRIN